jgi:polar amino acid transport system ATP-binding protein
MDEGIIYEEGTPEQIFDNPQKEKTRAFINRIRSIHYHITSPKYDLYTMNAEIEVFCEKQIIPLKTRQNLRLMIEELLRMYKPLLLTSVLDMTLAYSEKNESVELVLESGGEEVNLFDSSRLPDDWGLKVINSMTQGIDYQRVNNKNRLTLILN